MPPELISVSPIPAQTNRPSSNDNDIHVEHGGGSSHHETAVTELVISGISGKFPESENIAEFEQNLFSGVDMVTDEGRRFTPGLHGLPVRQGSLKHLDKFDASFFGVHSKQADVMDPQVRMLLELTHEAICDAGIIPASIRGSRTGVFVGCTNSESAEKWMDDPNTITGYELTGTCRGMFANRISFAFDLKGPSLAMDTACSSGLFALEQAVASIRSGVCDAAIVGGVNLCLNPNLFLVFHRLGMLSQDGKCKAFDATANGYVRSEAAVVMFIQKADQAFRSYATILHAKANSDGHKTQGVTFPSGKAQKNLLQDIYSEAGVSPSQVAYVECHGSGTKVGDPQELNAIAQVFCKDRHPGNPLLIGSVKSNMGHSEPASGLCSIVKVIMSMRRGVIPGNLHFENPNPDIPAFNYGLLKVVHQNTPWQKEQVVGVSSLGFGGANVHVILKGNCKNRPPKSNDDGPPVGAVLPILIPFSGRTKSSVESVLHQIVTHTRDDGDDDQLAILFQKIARENVPGHNYRGHAIMMTDEKKSLASLEVQPCDMGQAKKPPVWFVFTGMGCQWPRMGRDLLQFEVFEKSVRTSASFSKNYDVDLLHILLTGDDQTMTDIVNAFVCIAAVQIGLVDLLRSLQIFPDGIIGHSVGELGCAYADGCLTAEQTMLSAYFRGIAILEANVRPGRMIAVGLSREEAMLRCPPEIYLACHNAKDNVTLSGDPEAIKKFSAELISQGTFVKDVHTSGRAYHCPYVEKAAPILKSYLDKVIPIPIARSGRWVSTSVSTDEGVTDFHSPMASADYFVNNLLSPVLFHEPLVERIEPNSVVIEVAPHGLLQAILKRSLSTKSVVDLVNRRVDDNCLYLIKALGKIYNCGLNPKFQWLYHSHSGEPKIWGNAPTISSFISQSWDHSHSWDVPNFDVKPTVKEVGPVIFEIDLESEQDNFYIGHGIDGRIIFPAAGFIVMAWKAYAARRPGQGEGPVNFETLPVVLENFLIHQATVLEHGNPTKFFVHFLGASGQFRIELQDGIVLVTGVIREGASGGGGVEEEMLNLAPTQGLKKLEPPCQLLNLTDVSKILRILGFDFTGQFKGIQLMDMETEVAAITWTGNWVTYIDSLLQLNTIYTSRRIMYLPTGAQKIVIDPTALVSPRQLMTEHEDKNEDNPIISTTMTAVYHRNLKVFKCRGIEMRGITTKSKEVKVNTTTTPTLQKYIFTPFMYDPADSNHHVQAKPVTMETAVRFFTSIILDNFFSPIDQLNVLDFGNNLTVRLVQKYASLYLLPVTTKIITRVTMHRHMTDDEWTDLAILSDSTLLEPLAVHLRPGSFLLHLAGRNKLENFSKQIQIVAMTFCGDMGYVYLLRKLSPNHHSGSSNVCVVIDPKNFSWVEEVKSAMKKLLEDEATSSSKIYLVSQCGPETGILGLVKGLRREAGGTSIRCYFMKDKNGPPILSMEGSGNIWDEPDLRERLSLDLTINIFENGAWGSYCHFELSNQPTSYSEDNQDTDRVRVEDAALGMTKVGDLSSLRWIQNHHGNDAGDLLCDVYYAPLNFRDMMLACGKIPLDILADPSTRQSQDGPVFGLEFAGVNRKTGQRVMALASNDQGLATMAQAEPDFMWPVPSGWTLAEASTVPIVYSTVFYALIVRGRLRAGESILVHSGAGGVGQAAIRVALQMDCQVYTTVGSLGKRMSMKKLFPQLEDRHFANSRDTTFEQHIRRETGGRGVDLVLNSLAGEKFHASIRCLAKFGRFLELGKADSFNDMPVGMGVLLKSVAIHGVHLDYLLKGGDMADKHQVAQLMKDGLDSGLVQPLPRTIFGVDEVEPAFRFMASGKHTGKVVIQIRPECTDSNNDEEDKKKKKKIQSKFWLDAHPRTFFSHQKSYILVGGLGGFGLELGQFLIDRGARKLVLVGRSGVTTGYQRMRLLEWQTNRNDVEVLVFSQIDVTTHQGATKLLQKSMEVLGGVPIGGIFNLAVVARDAILENQTIQNFEEVAGPKAHGTKCLDSASRRLAPDLDHFVFFSSVASGHGLVAGSANYCYANSFGESICEIRRQDNLPGVAIQWGAIGDVGILFGQSETFDNSGTVVGTKAQRIHSCLDTLDKLLRRNDAAVLSSWIYADKVDKRPTGEKWSLVEGIATILGIKDVSKANKTTQLIDMGMDSLMSIEVKLVLERVQKALSADEVGRLTLTDIMEIEKENLFCEDGGPAYDLDGGGGDGGAEFSCKMLEQGNILWISPHLIPKEVIVKMRSAVDESDDKAPVLFFVHPLDGCVASMEKFAAKLPAHVYGLQCVKEAPLDSSISDLAEFYVEKMKSIKCRGPVSIVAYSFGGPVGCELLFHFQKMKEEERVGWWGGQIANILFVDTCHRLWDNENGGIDHFFSLKMDTPEADASAYTTFLLLFMEFEFLKLQQHIKRIDTAEGRLECVVDLLAPSVPQFSRDDIRDGLISFYAKLKLLQNYKCTQNIQQSNVVLLRTTKDFVGKCPYDYGLSEISEKQVQVFCVDATHITLTRDHFVDDVVQVFLDAKIC